MTVVSNTDLCIVCTAFLFRTFDFVSTSNLHSNGHKNICFKYPRHVVNPTVRGILFGTLVFKYTSTAFAFYSRKTCVLLRVKTIKGVPEHRVMIAAYRS